VSGGAGAAADRDAPYPPSAAVRFRYPRGGMEGSSMKRASLRFLGLAFLVVVMGLTGVAAKREQVASKADRSGGGPARRPTLDDLTAHTELERRPDGTVLWKRSFKHAIPYDDYLAALAAEERPISGRIVGTVPMDEPALDSTPADSVEAEPGQDSALVPEPVEPPGGGPGPVPTDTLVTCTPPDDDYDGDGFTLNTNPQDLFPLRRGEYIADRPRVKGNFTSYIEPGIDVQYRGSTEIVFESMRFYESDIEVKTTIKETREFKKKFNGSFGIKLAFAKGKLPSISLDLGLGGEAERSQSYSWTRETTRRSEEKFSDLRKKKETTEITVGPYAGKVSGQVTMFNLSDYAIDIDVTDIRIAVVAFSPFTGDKSVLGDVLVQGSFLLGFGAGNNSASAFVQLAQINTVETMNRLAEGWVFDMEMAYFTATDHATGGSVTTLISRVNQRNSRISIHYGFGSPNARQYGQVAVFQPGNACLTGKDLLTQYVGAANVEFDRLADGALVVKRINDRSNRFADRDFDTLTSEEKTQYGRWVIGFDYYNQPLTAFDLETTLLAPEDKIFFYFLTAKDFEEDPRPHDKSVAFEVANDGTKPASVLVTPVSTWDTVEIQSVNAFQIESTYTQYRGSIYDPHCGNMYGATWYGHQVTTDSRYHSITVPNVDWYGVQVDFGGQGWRTFASLLADPAAQASITQFRGFPDYDFTVRFLATPAMLGAYPTRNLQVRSANPRQSFLVGYEGYDVLGRRKSCRWTDYGGFHHNTGSTKVWYKLDNFDADFDTFYPFSSTGIDFDDTHARRFPDAPEHLDGIDNDGDVLVDDAPLICPLGLRSNESGTCVLDNRAGWYPASPNTLLERRFRRTDGTYTAWETIGSGLTSYTFTMTSDASLTQMEIRTTYWPGGGPSFSGLNVVYHTPGGDIPVFPPNVDFEAEAGRLVVPMRIDTVGPDTFIHVPAGTPVPGPALAEYKVNITQAGDYQIWTRVSATNSGDDSFLVTLLDPAGQPVDFGFGSLAHFRLEIASPPYGYNGFGWTRVNHWNPYVTPEQLINPILYHLNPGAYTIRIQPRELGTRLDKLRVERSCPDNDQDGYTTCAGDCNDSNPNVRPGRGEVCSTPYDDDCDGYINEGCSGGGSAVMKKVVY
jgi:putative metal-binding protein